MLLSVPAISCRSFDLAAPLLPKALLDELGLEKVDPDDVVLRPILMPQVVAR